MSAINALFTKGYIASLVEFEKTLDIKNPVERKTFILEILGRKDKLLLVDQKQAMSDSALRRFLQVEENVREGYPQESIEFGRVLYYENRLAISNAGYESKLEQFSVEEMDEVRSFIRHFIYEQIVYTELYNFQPPVFEKTEIAKDALNLLTLPTDQLLAELEESEKYFSAETLPLAKVIALLSDKTPQNRLKAATSWNIAFKSGPMPEINLVSENFVKTYELLIQQSGLSDKDIEDLIKVSIQPALFEHGAFDTIGDLAQENDVSIKNVIQIIRIAHFFGQDEANLSEKIHSVLDLSEKSQLSIGQLYEIARNVWGESYQEFLDGIVFAQSLGLTDTEQMSQAVGVYKNNQSRYDDLEKRDLYLQNIRQFILTHPDKTAFILKVSIFFKLEEVETFNSILTIYDQYPRLFDFLSKYNAGYRLLLVEPKTSWANPSPELFEKLTQLEQYFLRSDFNPDTFDAFTDQDIQVTAVGTIVELFFQDEVLYSEFGGHQIDNIWLFPIQLDGVDLISSTSPENLSPPDNTITVPMFFQRPGDRTISYISYDNDERLEDYQLLIDPTLVDMPSKELNAALVGQNFIALKKDELLPTLKTWKSDEVSEGVALKDYLAQYKYFLRTMPITDADGNMIVNNAVISNQSGDKSFLLLFTDDNKRIVNVEVGCLSYMFELTPESVKKLQKMHPDLHLVISVADFGPKPIAKKDGKVTNFGNQSGPYLGGSNYVQANFPLVSP